MYMILFKCVICDIFTAFGYRTQFNDSNTVPEVSSCNRIVYHSHTI